MFKYLSNTKHFNGAKKVPFFKTQFLILIAFISDCKTSMCKEFEMKIQKKKAHLYKKGHVSVHAIYFANRRFLGVKTNAVSWKVPG